MFTSINIYNYLKKNSWKIKNCKPPGINRSLQSVILMCIPFVNFIMLLVWAFSAGTPVSKANWAKATLIFMLIGFVLVILFWGAIGGLLLSNM